MNPNNYCVIMAGGVGSRFWPMSRNSMPKQFLDILGTGRSFLQQTYDRFSRIIPKENILVVTSEAYGPLVRSQLPELPHSNILLEKYRRNTAPCIAYASAKILKRNPDAVMVVAPSDHYISDVDQFTGLIGSAMDFASGQDGLYTIGVSPTRPETGYGYIQYNNKRMMMTGDGHVGFKVKTFTEKPDRELAGVFLESGEFLWNSGIFIWTVQAICRALEKWLPSVYGAFRSCAGSYDTVSEQPAVDAAYRGCEGISIDYGVMEKTEMAWVFQANFGWSDLGTWESLYMHDDTKDADGNMIKAADSMLTGTSGTIAVSLNPNKLMVIDGLQDYLVVDTGDVLLICPRDEKKFKQMLTDLRMRDLQKYQ